LQRLKEQIKAEKQVAAGKEPTKYADSGNGDDRSTKMRVIDGSSVDNDEGLVPKQRISPINPAGDNDEEALPDVDIQPIHKRQTPKTKIRADGGHGRNKKLVFDEDGNKPGEVDVKQPAEQDSAA
jgi:hypothetical protein